MTYIVGISVDGVNTILCDLRVTYLPSHTGQNTSVKSGVLFPGCIFGQAGSNDAANQFLEDIKFEMAKYDNKSEAEYWKIFVEFVNGNLFSKARENDFELLLSTRESGSPTFYLFTPSEKLTKLEGNAEGDILVTRGSGKSILDELWIKDFDYRLQRIYPMVKDDKYMPHITGSDRKLFMSYCIGFWLTQIANSTRQYFIEKKYGVGGLFHFIYQNKNKEERQKDSFYGLMGFVKNKKGTFDRYLDEYWLRIIDGYVTCSYLVASDKDVAKMKKGHREISAYRKTDILFHKIDLHIPGKDFYDNWRLRHNADLNNENPQFYFTGFGLHDLKISRDMILGFDKHMKYQTMIDEGIGDLTKMLKDKGL